MDCVVFGSKYKKIIVLVLLTIFFGTIPAEAVTTPLQQVEGTVEAILALMRNKELAAPEKKDERRSRIMAMVDQRFDFEEMSKRTLAREWKKRSEAEKREFEKLFSQLLKNSYIDRIEAYSDQKVEYTKEILDPKGREKAMVYTNIINNNRDIPINYLLREKGGEWFVYDVVIEGVSLVRNYRTEFSRILGNENFPGLIGKMQEKLVANEEAR